MGNLFVLDLTYGAGLELVEEHLEAHKEYLARNYANGTFLASGRKQPRTGGVILAHGDRDDIERIIATDPFAIHGAAHYTVTEFLPTLTGPALENYRVQLL